MKIFSYMYRFTTGEIIAKSSRELDFWLTLYYIVSFQWHQISLSITLKWPSTTAWWSTFIWVRQQLSANETFIALQCLCGPTPFSFMPANNCCMTTNKNEQSATFCWLKPLNSMYYCLMTTMTHATNILAGHNAINSLKWFLIQLHCTVWWSNWIIYWIYISCIVYNIT